MHPSLEQLLDLRDGEAAAPVREHVASCARCAAEVERLGAVARALRDLPTPAPSRDAWPAAREEALRLRRQRTRRRVAGGIAAAVAAVAILGGVGVTRVWVRRPAPAAPSRPDEGRAREDGAAAAKVAPEGPVETRRADAADLANLIRQSQRLEGLLSRVDRQPRLQSGREAAAIVSLQDQVALVDSHIARGQDAGNPAALVGLWRQRVKLLSALVEVQADSRESAQI